MRNTFLFRISSSVNRFRRSVAQNDGIGEFFSKKLDTLFFEGFLNLHVKKNRFFATKTGMKKTGTTIYNSTYIENFEKSRI